jgi:hypothetical protein
MASKSLFVVAAVLLSLAGFWLAVAGPVAAGEAEQRATRTPRPNLSASSAALKATANAGATRIAATATALRATATAVRATLTPPATVPADRARAAIEEYASRVLGLTVTVKKAGGITGEVTRALTQLPAGSSAQAATAKIAGVSYGATLGNGAATLSYGSGAITGDVTVDVQASSLGVYSLAVTNTGALNTDSALQLAKTTFPDLASLTYKTYPVSKGYAWYAVSSVSVVDPATRKVTTFVQHVILYVLPGNAGRAMVTATVGRGEFASQLKLP